MIEAIIYTSNTGNTEEYARLLSEEINIPYYSLKQAKKLKIKYIDIIYLGWIRMSSIQGYRSAIKKFKVKAVCGVGLSGTGTRLNEVRKMTSIKDSMTLFTLQGGLYMEKLHCINKILIKIIKKKLVKSLSQKSDRTKSEDDMLDILINDGTCVSKENLKDVLEWFNSIKS